MILRCTARLLALLGGRDLDVAEGPPADDDWNANLLWIERRKCLLLPHAGTLFPAFAADVRKPNLRALGPCVTGLVVDALADEGLAADTLGALAPPHLRLDREQVRRRPRVGEQRRAPRARAQGRSDSQRAERPVSIGIHGHTARRVDRGPGHQPMMMLDPV